MTTSTLQTVYYDPSHPTGFSEFVHFLAINKAIPRTILSKYTLDEIEEDEQGRESGKRAKLVLVKEPFFETLFPPLQKKVA